MDRGGESAGLIGLAALAGWIALFLAVVVLRATHHAGWAAGIGLAGSALLAVATGAFLLRQWRHAPDFAADGDVAFCGAVFLLSLMALAMAAGRVAPLVPILLAGGAIPARRFAEKRRRLP